MADATVTTTKQLNQDDLVRLVGAPVTLVSGSWTSTSAKTISAPVSQTALTTAINEYHYLPGEYTPQNAPDELTPLIDRAPAVLAGSDSFTSGEQVTILAWLLVAFHGAKASPPGTPGAQEPNPAGYSY